MAIKAPYLPYDKLRDVAAEFLVKRHPDGELPIPIEDIIEFQYELDIVPVPGLLNQYEVDAYVTSDMTEIRVDRFIQERRPNRYRFSLAHELAHVLVHGDIFRQLRFSTIAEWKKGMASIDPEQYRWIEWQAYCLGGLILVPEAALKALFQDQEAKASAAGVSFHRLDKGARRIVESNLGDSYFAVSADVIARRMKYDNLWESPK